MTNEIKRRGRPPQKPQEAETMTSQSDAQFEVVSGDPVNANQGDPAIAEAPVLKEVSFEEVMAWNRANADKLAPLPEKQYKKPRKLIRI